MDKRELYRTATVTADGSVFSAGEVVKVRVQFRMEGPWVFHCTKGTRSMNLAETYLKNFCL
jgi:hypothetical protein